MQIFARTSYVGALELFALVGVATAGVFAFNFGLAVVTGLFFGLGPALHATRTDVQSGLKDTTHTTTRRRRGYGGKAIVGFQIAVSMLLVATVR